MGTPGEQTRIGSLNEKPLHAALKERFAGPGDLLEAAVDGFVIDIVQDGHLLEIQTRNFSSIKRKLHRLTMEHKVRLIHPIAQEKWIVKHAAGRGGGRRKSPKRGRVDDVFVELVSIPALMAHPNFSLMVVLIQEEEVRRYDARRGWRRKGWVTEERRLIEVVEERLFESPEDIASFLPEALAGAFTTAELAAAMHRPRWFAQKMAYCLREMGVIARVGMRNRAILYERVVTPLAIVKRSA